MHRSQRSVTSSAFDASSEPDVLVIGAGPAGAVAAYELARRGLAVLLVDRKRFPRAKVCGGCLGPRAVTKLRQIGLEQTISRSTARVATKMTIRSPRRYVTIDTPNGHVIDRTIFDQQLVDAAVDAGATFLDGTVAQVLTDLTEDRRAVELRSDGTSQVTAAKLVLVCDGLGSSSLAKLPQLRPTTADDARLGINVTVSPTDDLPGDSVEMAVSDAGYVGIVRLPTGRLNLAAAVNPDAVRAHRPSELLYDMVAEVGLKPPEELRDATPLATPLLTRHGEALAERQLLLVGDAAGYVEPFTGEGMTWAIESALAVAPLAIKSVREGWQDDLATQWQATRYRAIVRRQRVCRLVTRISRHPRLIDTSLRTIEQAPWIGRMLVRQIHRV